LVPIGGSIAQALVSSLPQSVHLVSGDYMNWAQTRWGVILGGDPIAPVLDPDGDGAPNHDEYIALTDPRSNASRFRASLGKSGTQLTLCWPAVAGRNYQVFKRAEWPEGVWMPASAVQAGSGGTLQIQFDPATSGSQQFYRVQVTVP
jgi:hypothetical protein